MKPLISCLNYKVLNVLAALTWCLVSPGSVMAQPPEKKIDVHIAWPSTNFHTIGAMSFADLVKTRTGGAVRLEVHPGGSLGFKGEEVLRAVRQGSVPMAEVLMGNVEGENPVFGLTSLPLVAKDFDEAKKLYEFSRPLYVKAAAKSGSVFLYAAPWPPGGLFTKEKVRSISDLKGMKIRTYDANSAAFTQSLGATGLAVPFAELYTALSTGMVKGVLTSSVTGVDAKLWEVTRHFLKINYAFPLNMMAVRKSEFDGLDAKTQAVILEAARETEAKQWGRMREEDAAALKVLAEKKVEISADVPPEIESAMKNAAISMRDSWLKKLDANDRVALQFPGK